MGAGDDKGFPALPGDCPCQEARPREGDFYRLVWGDARDWQNHVQSKGLDRCEQLASSEPEEKRASKLCEFHALSVLGTLQAAQDYREGYPSLRATRIGRFHIDREWGVLHENRPDKSHYNWWPQGSNFAPPPPTFELVDE